MNESPFYFATGEETNETPLSYAYEVVADETGKFYGNAVRFATHQEAKDAAYSKAMAWTLVTDWRVVESADPVNYSWGPAGLEPVA